MSDSDSNTMPDATQSPVQAQRQPPVQQLLSSIAFMSRSANNESKRQGDTANAVLLPVSCALLVAAICLANTPQMKALGFALPLLTFGYYIAIRIGIVKTFTTRQAYLTYHILIATFLLGGTMSLFLVYVGTTIMLMITSH